MPIAPDDPFVTVTMSTPEFEAQEALVAQTMKAAASNDPCDVAKILDLAEDLARIRAIEQPF